MNLRENQKVCKIGISNNVGRRRSEVDKAIKGKRVLVLFSLPVFFAEYHEQRLHSKYGCSSYTVEGIGKGGGGSEWARLNALDRLCVRIDLCIIALEQFLIIILILSLLAFCAYQYSVPVSEMIFA